MMTFQQLSKEQAKEEIKGLIEKYDKVVKEGKVKSYNEEMTKKDFILPLFRALGWNVEDGDEVSAEEKISKKRVDYGFRIRGIPKFFLEAKALKEDLDNPKFVEQAINYAWHKGCTWAVLTDFESLKIFNAEWKSANPLQAQFRQTLSCNLFLEKFDTLWLLSKDSFEKKILDTEAEESAKKLKKTPVDKQLLTDLTQFRELLTKNILKNNPSKHLTPEELDEAVQRIIDRLIFIRTIEDKEMEAPLLQALIRDGGHKRLYKTLNVAFRQIDAIYNSKLFTPHLCEDLEVDDDILEKVIKGLFGTSDNTVRYDFSAIDADVLGSIYEQYLGYILKKTEKRAKLAEGKAHRKEQGIYYTPTYIVDYIVKNTVGELANDKKFNISDIKILDPACGSGSFLIKAFDYLITLDRKKNGDIEQTKLDASGPTVTYGRKLEILKKNIFGVDLDPKAVEIAQLNLLLKAAEKKHRLPTLQETIKVGNSIIDDPAFAGNRAFKWTKEFKEIMDKGGFDVVIGNPPYDVIYSKYKPEEFKYYKKAYSTSEYNPNLFILFLDKAIDLLNQNGYCGMIIPDTLLTNKYFGNIRRKLLERCKIIKIIDLRSGVFSAATVDTIIIIFQKTSSNNHKIKVGFSLESLGTLRTDSFKTKDIIQDEFLKSNNNEFNIYFNKKILDIKRTLWDNSIELGKISNIKRGMVTKDNSKYVFDDNTKTTCRNPEKLRKLLIGKDATRYHLKYSGKYILFDKSAKGGGCWDNEVFEANEKIIIALITGGMKYRINAAYDNQQYYVLQNYNNLLVTNQEFDIRYILGLLNSRFLNDYYELFFKDKNIKRIQLQQLPIKHISKDKQSQIAHLVQTIIQIDERLNEIGTKETDEKAHLLEELRRIDKEIEKEVYKLYGITEEDKKIIENSLK